MSNFYELRKEALEAVSINPSENVKTNLYGIIESINVNIMDLIATWRHDRVGITVKELKGTSCVY